MKKTKLILFSYININDAESSTLDFHTSCPVFPKTFFGNPLINLGVTLFLAWVLRPKVPEIEDFGTNEFDDFERGLLINKQSNDANIPVIYGERLVGGTRVFMETSGTDNTYLYMAIVMSEGEINSIEEVRVDDKVVTFASRS